MTQIQCNTCGQRLNYNGEIPTNRPFSFRCPKCGQTNTIAAAETRTESPSDNKQPSNSSGQPKLPPPIPAAVPAAPTARRLSPRQRRLLSDERETLEFFQNFPLINIVERNGDPAESYVVEYLVRGIEKIVKNTPVYRDRHLVRINLDGTYPRTAPLCQMITPIFHPNIEPAVICIGDHWTAQERLCHLIVRIGEIITYQSYNIHSPLDGLAAQWADLNPQYLPTDSRFLMP